MMIVNEYVYNLEHLLEREHQTNLNLLRLIEIYEERIDKAIKLIEDIYYSKNTTDIDSIVVSDDKLLQVRKLLKGVE